MNYRWSIFVLYCGLAVLSTDAGGQVTDADRQFWSFRPLGEVAIPVVKQSVWCGAAIDDFVLARMEQSESGPAPEASRRTLLRRVTLNLLGIAPTPQEIEDFQQDHSPHAWEKVVNRLLASPHYGERWARHWLDVVRFAESYGFEHDLDNDHAYHFRDFVIRALNDDMPFDRFVRWQLAGDELAPEQPLARMATAFLATGVRNADIAKVRVEQERYDELDDIASTIGIAMLGLSIGCARCHEHKYDPISQEDYYRFIAHFERTVRGEIDLAVRPGEKPERVLVAGEGITPLPRIYNPLPAFFETTWLLERGNAQLKDYQVTPGFPEVLTTLPATSEKNQTVSPGDRNQTPTFRRSALARWMTDAEGTAGSLLARVIVNRLWQHHFGRGIVDTPNDFGQRGARPTHPELLDWLAVELIRHDWQLKPLHRLILLSSTWRQATLDGPRTQVDDALFRGQRLRRLEAEAIRDQMLAISGEWDRRMFGPGSLEEHQPRRSIYFRVKRSRQVPMMTLFDAPDALQSICRRSESTVAPQALTLFNGEHVLSLAASFAERLISEHGSLAESLSAGFHEALGRRPTDVELRDAIRFVEEQQYEYTRPTYRIDSPIAGDALVVWLDATHLNADVAEVRRWSDRRVGDQSGKDQLSFSALTKDAPQLVAASTPLRTPAVRFGSTATILRTNDYPVFDFGRGDFSVSLVFRIAEDSRGDDQLLGKDSYAGGNNYTGFFFQHLRGQLRFATRNLVDGSGPVNYLDTTEKIRRGRWHRATGVRRSGELFVYLDEAREPEVTRREAAPTDVDNTVGFSVGDMDQQDSGSLTGSIAEVLVYNRGLTDPEVRRLHAWLGQKHLDDSRTPLEYTMIDYCQALFCLSEFIYVE